MAGAWLKIQKFCVNAMFVKLPMAEIKAAGKGDITHFPEIESEDLTKLYNNIYMDPKFLRISWTPHFE
jgi:hypothetical protein